MAKRLLEFIKHGGELKDEKHIMYKTFKQNPKYRNYIIDFEDAIK